MKRLPVKKDLSNYVEIGNEYAGLFAITFVYPQDDEPFIIKGPINITNSWLTSNYTKPCITHHSFYHAYMCIHTTYSIRITQSHKYPYIVPLPPGSKRKYAIQYYDNGIIRTLKKLKRIPRRWIKELDKFV